MKNTILQRFPHCGLNLPWGNAIRAGGTNFFQTLSKSGGKSRRGGGRVCESSRKGKIIFCFIIIKYLYEVCPKSIRPAFISFFFSIVRVLCTTNLLQEVRRSTKNITLKFWKDCVMPWKENDRVSGQAATGFFTTITRQRIHRTLCSNFWRTIRFYSFTNLRTVPT